MALRMNLGLVSPGSAHSSSYPGASAAEGAIMQTTEALTSGLVPGTPAVVATAVLKTLIGNALLTGRVRAWQ